MLGHTVLLSLYDAVFHRVSGLLKRVQETREDALLLELGHVLHGHVIWLHFTYKPPKLRKQPPVLVLLAMLLVLAVLREGLARSTPYQDFDVKVLQELLDFLPGDLGDVLADELVLAVVRIVGVLARGIEVKPSHHIDASGA